MSTPQTQAPAKDELEVSIFGARVGECVVVHVPGGTWFIVDSFKLKDGKPIAVAYLESLGVTEVDSFTISHWHRDHTAGAAEVIAAFPRLRMVALPGAVSGREYASFVTDLVPGTFAGSLARQVSHLERVIDALKAYASIQSAYATPHLALEPSGVGWTLRAVSPSADDARAALATLAQMSPSYSGPKPAAFDVNSGCTVLLLDASGAKVLLASDLEVGPGATRGWQAVVTHFPGALDASFVKVPHHGSDTAYHPPAWASKPTLRHAAITRFPARAQPLPRARMVATLRRQVDGLFITARHAKGSNKSGLVARASTPFTSYVPTATGALSSTGHVRLRVDATGKRTIDLFGGAYAVP